MKWPTVPWLTAHICLMVPIAPEIRFQTVGSSEFDFLSELTPSATKRTSPSVSIRVALMAGSYWVPSERLTLVPKTV